MRLLRLKINYECDVYSRDLREKNSLGHNGCSLIIAKCASIENPPPIHIHTYTQAFYFLFLEVLSKDLNS